MRNFKERIKEQRAEQAHNKVNGIIQNATLTIRADELLLKKVDELCYKYKVTKSELVRCLVNKFEDSEIEQEEISKHQRISAIEKGVTDGFNTNIFPSEMRAIVYDAIYDAITEDSRLRDCVYEGVYNGSKDK